MITCNLRGQLSNQAFIISTVIAHSMRTGIPYVLPTRSGKRSQFPMMFDHLNNQETIIHLQESIYREEKFGVYKPLPEPIDGNLHLQGYFQSFKYFDDYRDDVIEALNFPKMQYLKSIENKLRPYASVHVRRGDSLNHINKLPQPTDFYFEKAFEALGFHCVFVVFSDDISYCKEYFKRFDKYEFEFCEESDAKRAMSLMASMDHNIIVNSTFSLFASWLNPNPSKIVMSPNKNNWFGDAYKDRLSAQDIIPYSYIQIKY